MFGVSDGTYKRLMSHLRRLASRGRVELLVVVIFVTAVPRHARSDGGVVLPARMPERQHFERIRTDSVIEVIARSVQK